MEVVSFAINAKLSHKWSSKALLEFFLSPPRVFIQFLANWPGFLQMEHVLGEVRWNEVLAPLGLVKNVDCSPIDSFSFLLVTS
jgi:hypothetical protein